jgi:hypothetical protein
MRERFIKNKKPLNLAHIFPKKEKQPKTRTTRRAIIMSLFDDNDDKRDTLLKRQRRQEDITMRGSVNPQHAKNVAKKRNNIRDKRRSQYLLCPIQHHIYFQSRKKDQMGKSTKDGPRKS